MCSNFCENDIYMNYINGQWIGSKSKNYIEIYSPVDDSLIGKICAMSKDEVDSAIRSAQDAQKEWAEVPLHEKAEILNKAAYLLEKEVEPISQMLIREVAKDKKSAVSEVTRTAELIRFSIDEAKSIKDKYIIGDAFNGFGKNKRALVKREPLGVVLAISPFNYPINLAVSKIAPALAAGNTVVLKPATQGSISALHLVRIFEQAGIPKGVLNTITGRGSEIGDYAVTHSGIDMINFTGSTEVGERISSITKMTPLLMELGGKDPAIVLSNANIKNAAEQIINGAFSYSGQRCTAIKRVLVVNDVAEELVNELKNNIEKLKVGNPIINDDITIVPLIDDKSAKYIEELINDSKEKGAKLVIGGNREGRLIYPTLFDNVNTEMRLAWEEPFGPILPVIRVKDRKEAIEVTNKSKYGLQASVFTNDINDAFYISDKLVVGTVQINNKTERGPDNFPFLGVKSSGIGTQGVNGSIKSMTREKVVVLNL